MLSSHGLGAGFRTAAMVSMTVVSALRDLPPDLQRHPEVQVRLRRQMPRVGQQVLAMTRALRDLPQPTRKKIHRLLRENPGLRGAIRERRRAVIATAGLEHERLRQSERLSDRTLFRLERQNPSHLIEELVEKVRRASLDADTLEEDWDALIAVDLDRSAAGGAMAEVELSGGDGDRGGEPFSTSLGRIGLIVSGIGLGMGALGLLILAVGAEVGGYLTIIGGLVLTAGLALLLLALIVYLAESASAQAALDGEAPSLALSDALLEAIRAGELPLAPA